jgi:carbamoyl-phosphate synthase large subunit
MGDDFSDALVKALEATDRNIPVHGGNVLISVAGDQLKKEIIPIAKKLKTMGFTLFATEDTAQALRNNDLYSVKLYKVHEYGKEPNIIGCLQNGAIDLVINIPLPTDQEDKFRQIIEDEYTIRRMAVDYNVPVIINIELARALVDAIEDVRRRKPQIKALNEYHETLKEVYW